MAMHGLALAHCDSPALPPSIKYPHDVTDGEGGGTGTGGKRGERGEREEGRKAEGRGETRDGRRTKGNSLHPASEYRTTVHGGYAHVMYPPVNNPSAATELNRATLLYSMPRSHP